MKANVTSNVWIAAVGMLVGLAALPSWADSTLDAARKHGLKANESVGMGLTLMGKATKQPKVLWSINVMGTDTMLTWSIDSRDASLFNKSEVKLK